MTAAVGRGTTSITSKAKWRQKLQYIVAELKTQQQIVKVVKVYESGAGLVKRCFNKQQQQEK